MKSLAFTYLMTYGGGLVAVFNPYIGLLIYICFAIIQPPVIWWYSVPQDGNYSRIIAVCLLVGWLLQNTGKWTFGRAKPIVACLLGFMAWMTISALFAQDKTLAFHYVELQAKIVLPFIVGMTLIDSPAKLRQLAWVIVISSGYLAYEMNLIWMDKPNDLYFNGFGALDNNTAAVGMVAGAGAAFFLGLGENSHWRRWMAFFLAALQIHVVLFSMSRGGMLAMTIMAMLSIVLVLMRPKLGRNLGYLSVALVIGLVLAGPSVWNRFNTIFDEQSDASADSRWELWGACIKMMSGNPLFGVGPKHFEQHVSKFGFPEGKAAHTTWLTAGAETGVPGMLLFAGTFLLTMWLCYRVLWRAWRDPEYRSRIDPFCLAACTIAVSSLCGYFVAAQFVSVQYVEQCYYVALLGAGALRVIWQQQQPATPTFRADYDRPRPRPRPLVPSGQA